MSYDGAHPPVIGAALAGKLLTFRGRWVAVVGQEVVASGHDALSAAETAAGLGYDDPLIMKVRQSDGHSFIHRLA